MITKKGVYGILLWNTSAHDIFLHASQEAALCLIVDFDCSVTTMPCNKDWIVEHDVVEEKVVQDILQMAK